MRRRLNGIEGVQLLRGVAASLAAALGMGIGLWLWLQVAGNLPRWILALGGVALGGALYGLGVFLLRVPEVQLLTGVIARRLRRVSSQ
jgi:hypothetical protein